ncbi:MAG: hypothetical protein ABFD50_19355 [Smithella sp.]
MEHVCECGKPGLYVNRNSKWRCSKSSNACPAVKEKKKQACITRYGVENISQAAEVLAKKKATWMENYGVDNPSKAKVNQDKIKDAWPETERKRKVTMLQKFGVDSYCKTEEFQIRRKATWMERYGVDNPTKNIDVAHSVMLSNAKSEYKTKSMTLPSGKEIRYQGFENIAINDLLKSGVAEDEIITGPGNVPHIEYEFEGKTLRYYPDIYIPTLNLLIEVKSKYTWNKYRLKNLAKRQACIDAGFKFNVFVR